MRKLFYIITPHQINIQQGNFVSQEMLDKIQPGMTKEQVRFALGTPLLSDIFHSGRWDYMFRLQKPDGRMTHNRVVIYFDNNRVARIVNDPLPNEKQYLEAIVGPVPKKKGDADKKAPTATEKTAPAVTEQPAPVVTEQPAPIVTEQPAPVVIEQPAPVVIEQPAPMEKTTTAVPQNIPDALPDDDAIRLFIQLHQLMHSQ